ncbi:hypothetical protein [Actinoalloteichus caeruleus]|uniref:hypothetical protein n=1 Tax=Actinoalloteichus cyanogriseus TaxID=2893586 RepID=UPI000AB9BD39|nr:hypothetical protein [Actinoalloteichus caeruleus]
MAELDGLALVSPADAPPPELTGAVRELAADLLTGEWPDVPVTHLWCLVRHVPRGDRRGFLFQCWQDWTARLSPLERLGVAAEAVAATGEASRVARDVDRYARPAASWRRYREAVASYARAATEAGTAPLGYLLYVHACRSHDVLGIPPGAAAGAAGALRAVLTEAGNPVPPIRRGHPHGPADRERPHRGRPR